MLFIVAFAAVIVISGLYQDNGPGGEHIINNPQEYLDVLREAGGLSVDPMSRYERSEKLSAEDVIKLRKAATLYDELERFKPKEMGPYVIGGRVHLALGEFSVAELQFKQAIDDVPVQDNTTSTVVVHSLAADAHAYLAECYEEENKWKEALSEVQKAIALNANQPDYFYDRARAEIQLKQLRAAESDLKHVLTVDPLHARAASLLRFLQQK